MTPGGRPRALPVAVETVPITLGDFLKLAGVASTGGLAKRTIAEGLLSVNGSVERRRGRKLYRGDVVTVLPGGPAFVVA